MRDTPNGWEQHRLALLHAPEAQAVTCRCARCGAERHGTLDEAREWYAEHRAACPGDGASTAASTERHDVTRA